ncbi:hypothetical protein [Pseudescherichia vulneris]|uniref:hypothetical protein n=1 Tax=Pseudescherichia vulneris TaxID=566 RepID=UPI001EDCC0FB|nr:hypothetical protein [Pseudescherichia vulneris]
MLKLKKWQIAILIASVILFIIEVNVLVNIFIGKSADTGSISDWLSASSDVAMAIAALYAAWLAKNWLKPNLQQQGLPKVVAFLQNEISESLTTDFDIVDAEYLKSLAVELKECIVFSSEERKRRYQEIHKLVKDNSKPKTKKIPTFTNPFQFDKRIKEFEWYGFEFKNNKFELINQILAHKRALIQCNHNVLAEVSKLDGELFSDYIFYDTSNEDNLKKKLNVIIENLNKYSFEQIYNVGEMGDLNRKLMGTNPLVTEFFDIRKS